MPCNGPRDETQRRAGNDCLCCKNKTASLSENRRHPVFGERCLWVAGPAIAAGLSVSSAHAAPPVSAHVGELSNGLMEKVHGWHSYCARAHRHVPGVGNVPCYRGHYFRRHWNDYDDRGHWSRRDDRRCMIEPWLCRRGNDYDDRDHWSRRDDRRCMIEPWLCRRGEQGGGQRQGDHNPGQQRQGDHNPNQQSGQGGQNPGQDKQR